MNYKKPNPIKITPFIVAFFIVQITIAQNYSYNQDEGFNFPYAKTEIMVTKNGYAIDGYDTVSYFTDNEPKLGLLEFAVIWKDAKWLFSSKKHLDLFKKDPEKFAPQYGGWCAFGMSGHGSNGYGAQSNPKTSWTIHDKKLYLNWNIKVVDAWRKKKDLYIKNANYFWLELSKDISKGYVFVHWQKRKKSEQ